MNRIHSQSGIALMLSVLVLAAITAIAFSLATIVFIELRASRDVLKSEPALYATLGVTEEALFQYKRAVPTDQLDVERCLPKASSVCEINGVGMEPELLTEEEVPRTETVYAGSIKTIPLFYPESDDCDEDCSWDPPFSKIEIQLVPLGSTGTLTANVKWKARAGPEGSDFFGYFTELTGRDDWSEFLPEHHYQLELINPSEQNMQVSIWTYDADSQQLDEYLGLPLVAKRVLKVVAEYSGLTRAYRVEIPVGNSSLGN